MKCMAMENSKVSYKNNPKRTRRRQSRKTLTTNITEMRRNKELRNTKSLNTQSEVINRTENRTKN